MPKGTLGGYKGDYWKLGDNIDFYPQKLPNNINECFNLFETNKKISINSKVVIFGSCFSEHLMKALKQVGMKNVDNCLIPAGLNNIFAIRQILSYIINDDDSFNSYSYDKKYAKNTWKGDNKKIKKNLLAADLIILTVGLAEYWEDIKTGGKFWMGIPQDKFDDKIHKLKIATPDEISDEMNKISSILDKNIAFTLCPVPLNATFTKEKSIIANSISKSICRVGFHNFFSNNKNTKISYLPIYEFCYYIGIYYKIDVFEPGVSRHIDSKFLKNIGLFFNHIYVL